MNIKTKYKVNDEVYVIFKEESENCVRIYKGKIEEIVIRDEEHIYYIDSICEEFKESELFLTLDLKGLNKRMEELLNE